MSRQLLIIAGPEKGRSFPLEDGQILVIGRGQASDTQVNDPRMSRVHCRVQVDGGTTVLLDAGSSSGTFLGGEKVDRRDLSPGDVFQVGDSQFRFELKGMSEGATVVDRLSPVADPKPAAAAPAARGPVPLAQLIGQTFHHYRIDEIITSGTSGMVYKAHDTELDRIVAVKVLTPDFTNSDEQKERFVRAMKTVLPIRHPNLVQLYNAGKKGPYCWAAMEYVAGESLTQTIERIGVEGMLDWREVWRVAVHIARGLDEAYKQKIIHRNVTPTNILRRDKDKVCLLGDLMLAKALEGTLAKQVTQPGQLIGDVPYMSPERSRDSSNADCRSDLYGLGATLYALLTGKPPFESTSLPDLIRMVREAEPKKPKDFQLSINELFQDLVLRMLAKNPGDRPATAGDVIRELERIGRYNSLEADWTGWN